MDHDVIVESLLDGCKHFIENMLRFQYRDQSCAVSLYLAMTS